MAHQDVRERRLAGAVGPHDGVHLALGELEVDTLQDLGAVDRRVQVADNQVWHSILSEEIVMRCSRPQIMRPAYAQV